MEYRGKKWASRMREYNRTFHGRLQRAYTSMSWRVRGKDDRARSHVGLPILTREEFYDWAYNDAEYKRLYKLWEAAGHPPRLTPSIDRIDTFKGYVIGNMQWLPHFENVAKSNKFRSKNKSFYLQKD